MSASIKLALVPDAATEELWRVADTGDADELARVLPRIGNVNLRNQHGVTALMRAAQHGHAPIVRALLEHGADPNLTRNDKFTALALAAFFGHTETVRLLIEHGAKTEVVTRCNASARTWATARTYNEVARCLDLRAVRAVPPAQPVKTPPPAPVKTTPVALEVKTLKDPPEIWDLVHEEPRSFNPRSAFLTRIKSTRGSFALRAAAVLVISGACVAGAWALKGSQARSLPPVVETPPVQTATEVKVSTPVEPVQAKAEVAAPAPAAVVEEPAPVPVVATVKSSGSRRPRFWTSPSQTTPTVVVEEKPEAAVAPPTVAPPQVQTRVAPQLKPDTALSPHLVTPAKSTPPKGKVIQWP